MIRIVKLNKTYSSCACVFGASPFRNGTQLRHFFEISQVFLISYVIEFFFMNEIVAFCSLSMSLCINIFICIYVFYLHIHMHDFKMKCQCNKFHSDVERVMRDFIVIVLCSWIL